VNLFDVEILMLEFLCAATEPEIKENNKVGVVKRKPPLNICW
jgi:hypothetical protein